MTDEQLQHAFEKFIDAQLEISDETALVQMNSTPYRHIGALAAAFYMFRFGYELGLNERNTQ